MSNHDESGYRLFTGKSEAHKAFNSLAGIIEGISIDEVVNQKEISELELWCDQHQYLMDRNPFRDLITNIQVIISDSIVTSEEIQDMKWLCGKFEDGFEYYSKCTSDLQKLQGISHGLLSDGIINDNEVQGLSNWLNEHSHLASYYPYDEITALITEVLLDGKVDQSEKALLKAYFNEFVQLSNEELQEQISEQSKEVKIEGICALDPKITIQGHQFCFTGNSTRCSRSEIAKVVEELGGRFSTSVSQKTNFLVVGDDGNPCWAYACYGRKVEKAIELRRKGFPIIIVHENDFWDEVQDLDA